MDRGPQRRLELVLDEEIAAARSLASTLDAERAALTGDSPAAVVASAARKTELFGILDELEVQRRRLCDAGGISLPHFRHGSIPAITGASGTVADRWLQLLELIAGCRTANEVNGHIINARRGQVNQLLLALRGGAPLTYGPHGTVLTNSPRALARA